MSKSKHIDCVNDTVNYLIPFSLEKDPIKIKMRNGNTIFLSPGRKIKGSSEVFLSGFPYGKTTEQIYHIFDKLSLGEEVCLVARNIKKYKDQFKDITGFELRAQPMVKSKNGYILYLKK